MDLVAERDQVRAAWWQQKQDEVEYGFLVEHQNQGRVGTTWRPSHEWDWHGGCTESAGFVAVHHKTFEVTWLSHKTKTEDSTSGDGIRACREASKRATRDMIEVLTLGGREGPMDARPSNGELHVLTEMSF
jgi:hypothetical protein